MRFSDIIDQDFAVKVLKHSIVTDAISHAYMFAGLEGVGKTSTALAFAAALNCSERTPDGDACGECWSCHAIAEERHPDVELIAPETEHTKIAQMREMRHRAQFPPIRSPWKVIIIERAETLNEDSASAILKILEEPPSYAVMLLLTRNTSTVLPTILSRCQSVRFRQMPADALKAVLLERYEADDEKADFLARYSEGRPGIAISLLDDAEFFARRDAMIELAGRAAAAPKAAALRLAEDLRKICAPPKAPKKTKAKAVKGAKPAPLAEAAAAPPPPAEEAEPESAAEPAKGGRREIRQGFDSLILWYRDLFSLSLIGPDAPLINIDKRPELAEQLPRMKAATLPSILDSLIWAKRAIESNANTQLVTEVLVMRLLRR